MCYVGCVHAVNRATRTCLAQGKAKMPERICTRPHHGNIWWRDAQNRQACTCIHLSRTSSLFDSDMVKARLTMSLVAHLFGSCPFSLASHTISPASALQTVCIVGQVRANFGVTCALSGYSRKCIATSASNLTEQTWESAAKGGKMQHLSKYAWKNTCNMGESCDFLVRNSFSVGRIRSSLALDGSKNIDRSNSTPHRCCKPWFEDLRNRTILSICVPMKIH